MRARYRAENMEAYQAGKAANMPAPATMSQTSLPSQNGPMLLMATRRSMSVLPTTMCRAPTPEVEAFQDEEPGPEEGDDDEPENLQSHHGLLVGQDRSLVGVGAVPSGPGSPARLPRLRPAVASVADHRDSVDHGEDAVDQR